MELDRKSQILLLSEDRGKNETIRVDLQLLGLLGLFMESSQFNSNMTTSPDFNTC